MDFIQQAIQRARSARAETGEAGATAAPASGPAPQDLPDGSRERADLWAALPELPLSEKALEHARIVAHRGGGPAAPFDMMRTKLLHRMRAHGWRRLAITSPGPGCGKTMTSLNLAFSLARQAELHTMLVELDLRKPSISQVMGLGTELQFSEVLEGRAAPETHLRRRGANLAFALSARPVARSAELLQGVEAARLLDAVEAYYAPDVMIFDMPPMLVSDDALAFLDQVDCVLLMGAAGQTRIEDFRRCEADLSARSNLLGTVLNKCRYLDRSDSYGYGYSYGPKG